MPPEFRLDFYGFGEQDLDREFVLPTSTYIGGNSPTLKLREIIDRLKVLNFWIIWIFPLEFLLFPPFSPFFFPFILQNVYCKSVGIEYMHLTNSKQSEWIRKRFEAPIKQLSTSQKKTLYNRLMRSTKFEEFLAKKVDSLSNNSEYF